MSFCFEVGNMDYSWKQYLEDLRNGKTKIKLEKEDVAAAGFFIYRMGKDRQYQHMAGCSKTDAG